MRLIKPSVELLKQDYTLDGIYKQIELAGRTCYHSFDKITSDSAKAFVDRMIKAGHLSVLEQGTVYLQYETVGSAINPLTKYYLNKYSKVKATGGAIKETMRLFVTTNLRVLAENDWLKDLKYICEPTEFHEKRIAVRFICDRGVSHEFVRHRVFSFAQESTRYCNYSKNKFGNEVTFCIPCWCEDLHSGNSYDMELINNYPLAETENLSPESIELVRSLVCTENSYFVLLESGWKPQQARAVLPNSLKTELVMTGFESDWDHFFELRCSNAAHPDAQYLANMCKDLIKNNNNDRDS